MPKACYVAQQHICTEKLGLGIPCKVHSETGRADGTPLVNLGRITTRASIRCRAILLASGGSYRSTNKLNMIYNPVRVGTLLDCNNEDGFVC